MVMDFVIVRLYHGCSHNTASTTTATNAAGTAAYLSKRGGMQCKRASWCESSDASPRATLAAAAVAAVVLSPNN